MTANAPSSPPPAYLVVRQANRWTDVFRLREKRHVRIGRSSTCQIVVRSDQASREHAEIFPSAGRWVLRDRGSRNGTRVRPANPSEHQDRLQGDHVLTEGDIIEIAGYRLTFVHDVSAAFKEPASEQSAIVISAGTDNQHSHANRGREQIGDETVMLSAAEKSKLEKAKFQHANGNQSAAHETATITHRQDSSGYLEPVPGITGADPAAPSVTGPGESNVARQLFQLAFQLATADTIAAAANLTLHLVTETLGVDAGAVLLASDPSSVNQRLSIDQLQIISTRQDDDRSYRRVADVLAETVLGDGQAVLGRNLIDDDALSSADSRGTYSTANTVVAPIRIDGIVVGFLHVYGDRPQQDLRVADLEFVIAAVDTLGLGIVNLGRNAKLTDELQQSKEQVSRLQKQLSKRIRIVGDSPAIEMVKEQIAKAAPTEATVLVRGESGVGKELVAASIHHNSARKDGPLVTMNCAALSPTLLESELFGHEKGAFTGATDRKMGKFEAADGGTLMLDEIGEMAAELQAKFLRVLEGQPFERVGGNKAIKTDVRVVAATNRDLESAVRDGTFRSDLYYRLHVVEIQVPPLRDRGNDIIQIAEFFLQRFTQATGQRNVEFTDAAKLRLCQYDWPGNIRELKNVIERAVVLGSGYAVDASDLTLSTLGTVRAAVPPAPPPISDEKLPPQPPPTAPPATMDATPVSLAELEQKHILDMLRMTGGNKSKASQILGIERSTLDRKLKRAGLGPEDWA